MRRRAGFTLVELLVVIGIIALLIGILLPALSRAREQGRITQCLSNIRQLGQANTMYVNEFKGWCIPGYWGWSQASGGWPPSTPPTPKEDGPRRYWFQSWPVANYLGVKNSNPESGRFPVGLMCPSNVLSFEKVNAQGYTIHNSYSMNYTTFPGTPARLGPTYWNAWKSNEIISPADKIQFADGTSEGLSVYAGGSRPNSTLRYFDPYYGGEKHEAPDKGGAVAYRHLKGANVAYYDGHAAYLKMSYLVYDSADPSTAGNQKQWMPKMR